MLWVKSNLYSFEAYKNYKWRITWNLDKVWAVPWILNKHRMILKDPIYRSVFGQRTIIFSTLPSFIKLFIAIISMLLTWLYLLIAANSLSLSHAWISMFTLFCACECVVHYVLLSCISWKIVRCLTQGWIQWDWKKVEKKIVVLYFQCSAVIIKDKTQSPNCGDDCYKSSFCHAVV